MNAIQRLDAAEHLVDLVSTALRLGWQPRPAQVARLTLGRFKELPEADLVRLTSNLEAWISRQRAAIAAPVEAD